MNVRSRVRRARQDLAAKLAVAEPEAPTEHPPHKPTVLAPHEEQIVAAVRNYTMISRERLLAVMDAVEYVVRRGIAGALVECGVWRGGSVLAMILTLQRLGVADRDVYLYDTFEGMTQPTELDTSPFEQPALRTWEQTAEGEVAWRWAFDPTIYGLETVRELILGSGYPGERIHFVQGRVEETLPSQAPEVVAVARLDTDWYESTKHELDHLYPRMSTGGVLIIDDYGHWEGARRATEEFFDTAPILFARSDYSGRMGVKL